MTCEKCKKGKMKRYKTNLTIHKETEEEEFNIGVQAIVNRCSHKECRHIHISKTERKRLQTEVDKSIKEIRLGALDE